MQADLRIATGVERGDRFEIELDGRPIPAYEGETVAAALMAAGITTFRHTARRGSPRGIFCGMGDCFDCLMTVDGIPNVRTCVTYAQPGMKVESQRSFGGWGRRDA